MKDQPLVQGSTLRKLDVDLESVGELSGAVEPSIRGDLRRVFPMEGPAVRHEAFLAEWRAREADITRYVSRKWRLPICRQTRSNRRCSELYAR